MQRAAAAALSALSRSMAVSTTCRTCAERVEADEWKEDQCSRHRSPWSAPSSPTRPAQGRRSGGLQVPGGQQFAAAHRRRQLGAGQLAVRHRQLLGQAGQRRRVPRWGRVTRSSLLGMSTPASTRTARHPPFVAGGAGHRGRARSGAIIARIEPQKPTATSDDAGRCARVQRRGRRRPEVGRRPRADEGAALSA